MAERFRREDDAPHTAGAQSATTTKGLDRDDRFTDDAARDETTVRDRDDDRTVVRDGDDARHEHTGVAAGTMAAVRQRQRDEFGGIAWGSSFFGWLSAVGLGAILAALLSATGAALALGEGADVSADAETIGLAGGIALLVVIAIAYFCGGYVAGRMARFDGARQGIGVFAWTLVAAIVLAIAGVIGGSEYNVLERLDLPRIPIDEGTLTTGGIIALAAGLLTMLVAAVLGGKFGERFHRKVDRAAVDGRL